MDELEQVKRTTRWYFHLGVFVIVLILAYPYFTRAGYFGLLDYAILPFHEAGHFLLMPFGQTPMVWGGTLVQVFMPLGFGLYFWFRRKDHFAGLVCGFWLFQTLVNVSVYMRDARFMLLPLFGGGGEYNHDWNYLFGKLRLLKQSVEIADGVLLVAKLGMTVAILGLAAWLVMNRPGAPAPTEQGLPTRESHAS